VTWFSLSLFAGSLPSLHRWQLTAERFQF
jgi:hypothetical protein